MLFDFFKKTFRVYCLLIYTRFFFFNKTSVCFYFNIIVFAFFFLLDVLKRKSISI